MLSLLQWHVWYAPAFLVTLAWNMQRLLVRFFSVPLMMRTLVSHWHKDAVSYDRAGLSKLALAFAWNMISRVIGLIVRSATLFVYAVIALFALIVSGIVVIAFVAWPIIAVVGIVISLQALF